MVWFHAVILIEITGTKNPASNTNEAAVSYMCGCQIWRLGNIHATTTIPSVSCF
jgi:hypothetical protein